MSDLAPYDQKPPEYTSNEAKFLGRDFFVSPDTLIPRIETEEIISKAIELKPKTIADIGCGSGCIGLSIYLELQKRNQNCQVYLSDISDKAIEIAKTNLKRLVPNYKIAPIEIFSSDLMANFPANLAFDLIVANLPYIPTSRIAQLPGSVKNFEPHIALDGGDRGVTIINRLLEELPNYLSTNGTAILEIDDTHELKDFKLPIQFKAQIDKDQFGRNRFLVIKN